MFGFRASGVFRMKALGATCKVTFLWNKVLHFYLTRFLCNMGRSFGESTKWSFGRLGAMPLTNIINLMVLLVYIYTLFTLLKEKIMIYCNGLYSISNDKTHKLFPWLTFTRKRELSPNDKLFCFKLLLYFIIMYIYSFILMTFEVSKYARNNFVCELTCNIYMYICIDIYICIYR